MSRRLRRPPFAGTVLPLGLGLLAIACSAPEPISEGGDYEDLATLFQEWRAFEMPGTSELGAAEVVDAIRLSFKVDAVSD